MTSLLIVDDELEIAELLAMNLGRRGFACRVVGCAEEAIAAAGEIRPDLILMDMSIPFRPGDPEDDEGGRWAVRQIMGTPGMAHVPVIAVTGHTESHRVAKFREAGCVDIVNKPVDYDLLYDRIRRLTGHHVDDQTPTIAAGAGSRTSGKTFAISDRRANTGQAVAEAMPVVERARFSGGSLTNGVPHLPLESTVQAGQVRRTALVSVDRDPHPAGSDSLRDELDRIESALRGDERRQGLCGEHKDYEKFYSGLVDGLEFARQMLDGCPPAQCGWYWEHEFRNAVARIQGKVLTLRKIEQECLLDGFDPLLDQTDRALQSIFLDPRIPLPCHRLGSQRSIERSGPKTRERTSERRDEPNANTPSRVPVPQAAPALVADDGAASLASGRRTGTILVADDNADGRTLVAGLLRRDGHDVIEAVDGCDAMNRLRDVKPALVILDLDMPGLSGMDVLKQLKGEAALRRIPVLMVSGSGELERVVEAIRLGAEDYLTKPIDATLLRVRIDAALERERLRRKDLEDFFPPEIIEAVESDPGLLKEPRTGVDVTLLICDIRGFSRITEELRDSTLVLRWLNAVMSRLTQCVLDAGGTVVDYIGDELLAMWGAPTPCDDHAQRACAAAQAMLAALPELNDRWRGTIRGSFDLGIGLNSGPVHVGNTGSSRRFKYGPLGNAVNIASRVQGATKYTRTNVLITGETRRRLQDGLLTRRLGRVRTVNISEPIEVYELPDVAAAGADFSTLTGDYEDALLDFEAGRLQDAIRKLGVLIGRFPSDGPSLVLLSRAVQMQLGGGTTDPVWDLPGK